MLRLPVHTAVTILLTYATAAPVLAEEGTGHRPLAHTVYFDLKVSSEQSQAALIRACREKLAKIEGITYFAVGRLAPELQRPVNDRDFDVACTLCSRTNRPTTATKAIRVTKNSFANNRPMSKSCGSLTHILIDRALLCCAADDQVVEQAGVIE